MSSLGNLAAETIKMMFLVVLKTWSLVDVRVSGGVSARGKNSSILSWHSLSLLPPGGLWHPHTWAPGLFLYTGLNDQTLLLIRLDRKFRVQLSPWNWRCLHTLLTVGEIEWTGVLDSPKQLESSTRYGQIGLKVHDSRTRNQLVIFH